MGRKGKLAPPAMEIHLDIIVKKPRMKSHPKIKLEDDWFHTIHGNLTTESTFDSILETIESFVCDEYKDDDKAENSFKIISTPNGTLFGRFSPRKNERKRSTNDVIPVSDDNVKKYIEECHVVTERKPLGVRVGKRRKKLHTSHPVKVVIDLAVVVKVVVKDNIEVDAVAEPPISNAVSQAKPKRAKIIKNWSGFFI